ncbi:hypothetical protein BGZ76_003371 [Entomortierella beljakovae]|nr:hypothetical protein BGZ76_003371 [Entomortierella beljakovae]
MSEHVANAAVADVLSEFSMLRLIRSSLFNSFTELFASTQKYSCPIKTARHPGLISYIEQVVRSIWQELQKDTIQRICFVTLDSAGQAVERFVFEMSMLRPFDSRVLSDIDISMDTMMTTTTTLHKTKTSKGKEKAIDESDPLGEDSFGYDSSNYPIISGTKEISKLGCMMALTTDVETMFRGMIMKLGSCNSHLKPLDQDCTFTIEIEMRVLGDGPESKPGFMWSPINPTIPSEQSKLSASAASAAPAPPSRKIIPVKTIDIADIQFELFIERMGNS